MSEKIINLTTESFKSTLNASPTPVLVDFWAPWCGPCRAIGPHVESLAAEWVGKVKVVKVNVDESPQTSIKYGIRSIPALMVFKGGEVKNTKVGAPTSNVKGALTEFVTSVI